MLIGRWRMMEFAFLFFQFLSFHVFLFYLDVDSFLLWVEHLAPYCVLSSRCSHLLLVLSNFKLLLREGWKRDREKESASRPNFSELFFFNLFFCAHAEEL